MSVNLLKSPSRLYNVLLKHQVLPRLTYPAAGETILLHQKSQEIDYYVRVAGNLQKHVNICCCGFDKISIKRKNICATRNFYLTINIDLISLESLMVSTWNLVCGCFINFEKDRKFLTLFTFGCLSSDSDLLQHDVRTYFSELRQALAQGGFGRLHPLVQDRHEV